MPWGSGPAGETPWGDGDDAQPALAASVVFYLEFTSPDSFENRVKLQPLQTSTAPSTRPQTKVSLP